MKVSFEVGVISVSLGYITVRTSSSWKIASPRRHFIVATKIPDLFVEG